MKKIGFVIFVITVVFFSVFCFACTVQKSVQNIFVKEGAVKYAYDVDESFGKGYVTVVFSDGTQAEREITPDMVTGFDTTTTGKKTMTISCEGFFIEQEYEVVYEIYPSKEIISPARIYLTQSVYPTGIGRTICLKNNGEKIYAISFTVKGSINICDNSLNTVDIVSIWDVKKYYVNAKTFNVVMYLKEGINADSEVATINFAGISDGYISLVDICFSDGVTDKNLPDCQAV